MSIYPTSLVRVLTVLTRRAHTRRAWHPANLLKPFANFQACYDEEILPLLSLIILNLA